MEPNYSEYSISELEESLSTIDREAYPERTEKLESELNARRSNVSPNSELLDEDFEPNEQFYKCPNCEEKIGFFSKAANKWGKMKICPHCCEPFESVVKHKVYAIAIIPVFIIHLFFLKPIVESLGLDKSISIGILCGIIVALSLRFKRVRVRRRP